MIHEYLPGWVVVVLGVISSVLGVYAVIFRRQVLGRTERDKRRFFGALGDRLSGRATPNSLLPAGIAFIFAGIA